MLHLSGTKCHVCGIALEHNHYVKDEVGRGIYWANPRFNPGLEKRLDFCGAAHSTQWTLEQIEARKNATPDTLSDS